ncbi:extracellular solute-binding protein [Shinella sp. 838]|uniref:ABC transporter substrate-binding protein n=1 Tax=Shinella sp. 838 TaxID=3038164 RepID=UPI002414FD33|nr:extracellular solute-binding protein [Shinella sp. 838]MDG4674830.1 extracellular solute-binding protein [Shinella sp. 838]
MNKTLRRTLGAVSAFAILSGAALAEPIKLDVTAWKGNESEPAGLSGLIASFEAANPDIDVELSYISRTDTDVVIPPRLQGGNPPDVMMVDMPLVKVWGDAGFLQDFGTDAEWYGRVPQDLRSAITLDGKAYIMPLEVIGMGLFTNMGMLKSVGIDAPPQTLDDLKTACAALAAAGKNAMMLPGTWNAELFVIANGLGAGTTPASDLGNGTNTFVDDAGFNAALDTVRDLAGAGCFNAAQMAGVDPWSTALAEFKAGNFAMMPQGAWNIASFKENSSLEFVFGPIPTPSGGVAVDLFGIGWAASSASDNPEAAKKFIEFFAKAENLQVMLDAEAAYSPFDDGASGTPEQAAPYDAARAAGAISSFPYALLTWPKPLESEIADSLSSLFLELSKTNEEILNRWDEVVEDDL